MSNEVEVLSVMLPVFQGGSLIGHVWKDENGWCAESSLTGNSWDFIDSEVDARDSVNAEAVIYGP